MKVFENPSRSQWESLTKRPEFNRNLLTDKVTSILNDVKNNGDQAIFNYAKLFDGVELNELSVSTQEVEAAIKKTPRKLKEAIEIAFQNITVFHQSQQTIEPPVEFVEGVRCWRKSLAIDDVGLYIPGGSAPLFSTILMLGIPARIAGCKNIILCTPPNSDQSINPSIIYTAHRVGIKNIYKVGGAQAIAALAFGTPTIPSVSKIFGPGNQFVTKAKELVQQEGVAIDMPAGPSELLVIADDTCIPEFVAADLLSQAEHGVDSQVILVSNNRNVVKDCLEEVYGQVEKLPRKDIALKALVHSKAIVLSSLDECFEWSNAYAPEHLIIASENGYQMIDKISNAGSVFIGNYSCESAGDYASGTNHTLPTNGYAKAYSGVSLDSFVKKITFQEISPIGIEKIGPAIEIMADAEGLFAHKNAAALRRKNIKND